MRAFTNYNNVQEYTDSIKLPAGAYKAKSSEQRNRTTHFVFCLILQTASTRIFTTRSSAMIKRLFRTMQNSKEFSDFGIRQAMSTMRTTNAK